MTDILSKDISRVAVEAGECMGLSESLFEGTQFKGPFTGPFPVGPPWRQPQSRPGCWAFPLGCMGMLSKLAPRTRGTAMAHCPSQLPPNHARRLYRLPQNWPHLPNNATSPLSPRAIPTAPHWSSRLHSDPSSFSHLPIPRSGHPLCSTSSSLAPT